MTGVVGRDVGRPTEVRSDDIDVSMGELYDRHGAALFNLAYVVSLDPLVADAAVVRAFTMASAATKHSVASITAYQLARLTFLACYSDSPRSASAGSTAGSTGCWDAMSRRQRALLALTVHGGHSYRDAAALLELNPTEAAEVLRTTLHEAAALGPDGT